MLVEGVGEMRRRSMKDNRSVAGATWGKVIIIITLRCHSEYHWCLSSLWFSVVQKVELYSVWLRDAGQKSFGEFSES